MFHNMYESVIRAHTHESQLSSPRSVSHDKRARCLSRKAEQASREARLSLARAL